MCQCENLENGTLKATYIICNSSPHDTSFSFFYFYNSNNSLDRIEKFFNKRLESIDKYVYDKNFNLIKIQEIIPQTYENLCGNSPNEPCMDYFKDKIVKYDTLNAIYYLIAVENPVKPKNDSIYKNGKLITVLSGLDTLYTFQYDNNNKLIRKNNYCDNDIFSWITYNYKKQFQIEYHYKKGEKKPNLKIESEFNDLNQLVSRKKIYFFDEKIQPSNNYKTENFEYEEGKLKVYESFDNYIDPCFNYYCCGRYKKIYEYE